MTSPGDFSEVMNRVQKEKVEYEKKIKKEKCRRLERGQEGWDTKKEDIAIKALVLATSRPGQRNPIQKKIIWQTGKFEPILRPQGETPPLVDLDYDNQLLIEKVKRKRANDSVEKKAKKEKRTKGITVENPIIHLVEHPKRKKHVANKKKKLILGVFS